MLSNPENSSVCDTGTLELVLHKPFWAYKWQFALLARLPGVTPKQGCSSSEKQQPCVQNKPGNPHTAILASLGIPDV